MFCPQLHYEAGIDCVHGSGTGIIVIQHTALLETYKGLNEIREQEKDGKELMTKKDGKSVQFNLPSETKDLAYYGFDYRFTDATTTTSTNKRDERKVSGGQDGNSNGETQPQEFSFTTRLYHTKSDTMITLDNFRKFGLHGKLFDQVSGCCQDIVQQELRDFYRYDVVTIPTSSHVKGGEGSPPIQAFVSPDLAETLSKDPQTEPQHSPLQQKPILLIMCGKGTSRAGVLSTKQLLLSGMEAGSGVYHILQAYEQEMSVILLDPNAWGENKGMEVVYHSLTYLFGGETDAVEGPAITASAGLSRRPLYILAHSASGGYLTRYLSQGVAREILLNQIRRIAFTDSTHNLQWYKSDTRLWDYLQSQKCLYIRNNSAPLAFGSHHDKRAGEKHEGDHWWHHRFGSIPTVWAGTPKHSLMCWTARHVIWNFFTAEEINL